jgi:hypothetical protein
MSEKSKTRLIRSSGLTLCSRSSHLDISIRLPHYSMPIVRWYSPNPNRVTGMWGPTGPCEKFSNPGNAMHPLFCSVPKQEKERAQDQLEHFWNHTRCAGAPSPPQHCNAIALLT